MKTRIMQKGEDNFYGDSQQTPQKDKQSKLACPGCGSRGLEQWFVSIPSGTWVPLAFCFEGEVFRALWREAMR